LEGLPVSVTHTSQGFTGTVDEVAWANMSALASHRFRVASATDWAVSVSGSTARTVNIAAGSAWACGVRDITSAQDTVAFATNSGGSNRYDALVASFVWGSDTVTFKAITGTTSPPAVNSTTTVSATKINRIPGVQYDALLAVVQIRPSVGILASGDLFDMRPYGGLAGPLLLPNSTYLTSFDAYPGAEVYAVDTTQRWLTLNGTTWTWPPEPQGELQRTDYTGTATLANADTGLPALTVTTSFIPSGRRIRVTYTGLISADASATYSFKLYRGGYNTGTFLRQIPVQTPGSSVGTFFTGTVTYQTATNLTNQQWTLGGSRTAGTGTVSLFGDTLSGPVQYIVEDVGAV
jgi:hypothetical protein